MRVRINNKSYDSDNEPLLLVLSNYEKEKIKSLPKNALSFGSDLFKEAEVGSDK
jgi:hypothetical protein